MKSKELVLDLPIANLGLTSELLPDPRSQQQGPPQAPPPEEAGWRQQGIEIHVEHDPDLVS
jgi:hypothetical protein